MDHHARAKLEKNLRRVGLLMPLVVNRTTWNVVAGHQRLAILDALASSPEYLLDVALVELTPDEEQEQLIFMNNESAMGMWDLDGLEKILRDGIDWDHAGFDQLDLEALIPDASRMFNVQQAEPEVQEHLQAVADFAAEAKTATRDAKREERGFTHDETTDRPIQDTPETKEGWKNKRHYYQDQREAKNDPDYFLVVVFPDNSRKSDFLRLCGLPDDERYVDGLRLAANVGLDLPALPTGTLTPLNPDPNGDLDTPLDPDDDDPDPDADFGDETAAPDPEREPEGDEQ